MTTSNDTTWRDIPGFEGKYQVSVDGQVRSITKGKNGRKPGLIFGKVSTKGYHSVSLRHNDQATHHSVHRLVMLAFVGLCPPGMQVNHIDGNKLNNNLSNLEYVTPGQNIQHAFDTHLREGKRGETHWKAKLTAETVIEMRRLYAAGGILQREIGIMFGVSNKAVSEVITRKNWKHVP